MDHPISEAPEGIQPSKDESELPVSTDNPITSSADPSPSNPTESVPITSTRCYPMRERNAPKRLIEEV